MAGKATKPSGSGCKPGTPNQRTVSLIAMVRERFPGYDPLLALAELTQDPKLPKELAVRVHSMLAEYFYPKRKALDAPVTLPELDLQAGIHEQISAVLRAMAGGDLSIEQSARLIESLAKAEPLRQEGLKEKSQTFADEVIEKAKRRVEELKRERERRLQQKGG